MVRYDTQASCRNGEETNAEQGRGRGGLGETKEVYHLSSPVEFPPPRGLRRPGRSISENTALGRSRSVTPERDDVHHHLGSRVRRSGEVASPWTPEIRFHDRSV